MHQFKDNASPAPRLWTISLTIASVRRVKNLLGIDLLDVSATPEEGKPPLILDLLARQDNLCDVLYVLCKPEADKIGVTDEQFGESMGGGALLEGTQAFMAELIDFFHQSGRTEMATVVRQAQTLRDAAVKEATARLATIDVAEKATVAVGNSFTAALASLDKALTTTPSAS